MSLYEVRDVQTGRISTTHTNAGGKWAVHANQKSWWVVSVSACTDTYADKHTHEVVLFNIGPNHSSPTWPILALFSEADAKEWEKKLRAFAKTLDADATRDFFNKEVNGDSRLAEWLTDNGWGRYNHVWWTRQ